MIKKTMICEECAKDLESSEYVLLNGRSLKRFCSQTCLSKAERRKPSTNWWEDAYNESFMERNSTKPLVPSVRPVNAKNLSKLFR